MIALNVGYGVMEMIGGYIAGSQALKADALDFLGDGLITLGEDHRYEGQFAHDQFSGQGIYSSLQETYQGEFLDDEYHGQGTLTSADGDSYTGGFVAGEFHGEGLFTSAAGISWSGKFNEGNFQG